MSETTKPTGHGVMPGTITTNPMSRPTCRCGAPWSTKHDECARRLEWAEQEKVATHWLTDERERAMIRDEIAQAKARYGE